ncbi:MAG: hypothetical protein DWQ47_11920 [Acidobacteria bacterium]|nr:MAG: hypothetical protein DWQ32_14335 [Acidobacteriota bacterium]REJ98278.1 MAG: hypothetical protein DWQ38_17135 [Acidobacteriota bacterium]REK17022.1 MAG: hypothetical protein DWQ43_02180 [Acidobacteriota bacterium]REK42932.1 MAG: hypothetical protein DWQ47_11920 [Acidobacteriota bacterium]
MNSNKEQKMLLQGLLVWAFLGFVLVILWILTYLVINVLFFNGPNLYSFGSFVSAFLAGIFGIGVSYAFFRKLT